MSDNCPSVTFRPDDGPTPNEEEIANLRAILRRTTAILRNVDKDTFYGIHDEWETPCKCGLCEAEAYLSKLGALS